MSLILIGVFALALQSCGGGDEESGADPKIRLLNLSTGYTALDMMTNLDSDTDDDDETQATGVALETVSEYATLDPDDYTVKVRRTGSGSVLRSFAGEELVEDTINTYVAYGEVGNFGALRIDDTLDEADAGETRLRVANVSSAGALDVYLTDAATDLDDTTPVLSNVGAALSPLITDSGTYRLRVTAAGDSGRRAPRRGGVLADRSRRRLAHPHLDAGRHARERGLSAAGRAAHQDQQHEGARARRGRPREWRECVDPGGRPVGAQRSHRGRDRQPLYVAGCRSACR